MTAEVPEPTTALGINEIRRGKPRWTFSVDHHGRAARAPDAWDTGFVDLADAQGLLGQVEGRTNPAVVTWLRKHTPEFREGILSWRSTRPRSTPKAVRTVLDDGARLLPNATSVVDHFHFVNLTDRERLSEKGFITRWNSLIDSDPTRRS